LGVVSIDIHKKDRIYQRIVFSDKECVKGLIKNRNIIDDAYNAKLYDKPYDIYTVGSIFSVDEEILCIYMDLERLIKKCNFNKKQLDIINLYFKGYATSDICDVLGYKESSVDRMMETIAKKIVEQNNIEYIDMLHYGGYVKVDKNARYKQCSKCSEFKDVNKGEFSYDKTNNRWKSQCLTCIANSRSNWNS
jgi:transposase-like protein